MSEVELVEVSEVERVELSEVEVSEMGGVVGMDWLHEVDKSQVGVIGVIEIVEAALADLHAIGVSEVEVGMSQVGAVDTSEDGDPDLQNVAVVARSSQMGEFVDVIGMAQIGIIVTAITRVIGHLEKFYYLSVKALV
eukprot:GHVN01011483.1.p2 GENE.GHVN01011483.1~~GHVN01011483.1.p2  ORF type:complete len:149 (+),score=71.54 GHVN01011483.1:39-449(+)